MLQRPLTFVTILLKTHTRCSGHISMVSPDMYAFPGKSMMKGEGPSKLLTPTLKWVQTLHTSSSAVYLWTIPYQLYSIAVFITKQLFHPLAIGCLARLSPRSSILPQVHAAKLNWQFFWHKRYQLQQQEAEREVQNLQTDTKPNLNTSTKWPHFVQTSTSSLPLTVSYTMQSCGKHILDKTSKLPDATWSYQPMRSVKPEFAHNAKGLHKKSLRTWFHGCYCIFSAIQSNSTNAYHIQTVVQRSRKHQAYKALPRMKWGWLGFTQQQAKTRETEQQTMQSPQEEQNTDTDMHTIPVEQGFVPADPWWCCCKHARQTSHGKCLQKPLPPCFLRQEADQYMHSQLHNQWHQQEGTWDRVWKYHTQVPRVQLHKLADIPVKTTA